MVLNTVLGVLKEQASIQHSGTNGKNINSSKGVKTAAVKMKDGLSSSSSSSSSSLPLSTPTATTPTDVIATALSTSIERAIEVLAGLSGRTYIKEELVHGSNRVAASCALPTLIAIHVDPTSTAAYGLAHIFAALSVTNKELKIKVQYLHQPITKVL